MCGLTHTLPFSICNTLPLRFNNLLLLEGFRRSRSPTPCGLERHALALGQVSLCTLKENCKECHDLLCQILDVVTATALNGSSGSAPGV